MKVIRFFRYIDGKPQTGPVRRGEIAFSERELFEKLNGDTAEIHMPAKPWYVRLWRRIRPLKFTAVTHPADGVMRTFHCK